MKKQLTIAQVFALSKHIEKIDVFGNIIDFDRKGVSIEEIKPNAYAKNQDILCYRITADNSHYMLAPNQLVGVTFIDYGYEILQLERRIQSLKQELAMQNKAIAALASEAEK